MKADELILHIGHAKTGTTTLQRTLAGARETLRQQGILFPKVHPGGGNAIVLGYFLFNMKYLDGPRQRWLKMTYPELVEEAKKAWDEIRRDVAATHTRKVVISSEHFFRTMSPALIQSAGQKCDSLAEATTIVAYLRAPDSHFLSVLQEGLKMFRTPSGATRWRLKETLAPLNKHWKGGLSLNLFDRHSLHGGDIFDDFVNRYLPEIDCTAIARQESPANTSISAEAMAILHDITLGIMPWNGDRVMLAREIRRYDQRLENPTKPRMRPGLSQFIVNWQAPDLFWLRDEMGITFPSIDYAAIDPEDIDADILRFSRIEDVCEVNAERKAELAKRAVHRAKLPKQVKRWMAKF